MGSSIDTLSFDGTERFAIQRQLGEGGMGVVYEAVDRKTSGRVAIKTLKHVSARALARLKTEFRALQELQHPNLVSLGELVEEDGHWFITMELVEGTPLLDFIRSRAGGGALSVDDDDVAHGETRDLRRFDEGRLRDAFGQLAVALTAVHGAGLVHRDVKPSNALVTRDGRVVLLDFGLVSDVRGRYESLHDDIVGTAAYMAPEQASAHPVTAAADWYAFGIVLFEALTGTLPYAGPTLQVLLDKQQREAAAPSERAPGVPEDLDELCRALLAFDPAARPSGDQVLRAFGVTSAAPASSTSNFGGPSDLVGRDPELAQLRDAARDAREGGPLAVLLRGASGLGKSVLVEAFLAELRATEDSAVVLSGRCFRNESVPFKALDGVIDALAAAMLRMRKEHAAELVPRDAALLPQLFPTLGRVEVIARAPRTRAYAGDPVEQRARGFAALRELLQRVADRQPLVLHIDDIHWSDDDSARLLDELLRPPDAPAMLVVATMRDGYAMPALPCDTRELDVGPLAPDAARALADTVLRRIGAPSTVSAAAIADEARGHPLHIEELARHVVDTGASTEQSPKLDDAIWARIGRLSDDARGLVELVAVAASPLPDEVFLAASELPAEQFARCVSSLRVSHLVKAGGNPRRVTLQHYHDRVRESVTTRLSDEDRAARHRRLAVALELTAEPDLERLGAHLLGAGERGRAIDVLARAADDAADKTAFGRAARLYQQTLELVEPEDSRRFELQQKLGDALATIGRGLDAAAAYRAALPGVTGASKLVLQRKVAEQLLRSGHQDEGLAAIDDLARSAGMSLAGSPRRALLRLIGQRARLAFRGYDYALRDEREVPASELARIDTAWALTEALTFSDVIQGSVFHVQAVLASLRAGEPRRLVRSFAGEVIALSIGGTRSRRRYAPALRELDSLLDILDEPDMRAFGRLATGMVALQEGRFGDALGYARAAEEGYRAISAGNQFQVTGAQVMQVWALSLLGRMRDALARVPDLLRDARDRSDQYTATTLSVSTGYYAPLLADDPDAARELIDDAVSAWSRRSVQVQHIHGMYARMMVELYHGDTAAAFAGVEEAWGDVRRSLILRHELLKTRLWDLRGRAALAHAHRTGDRMARAVARRSVRALRRCSTVGAAGLHAMLASGVAFDAGDRDGAAALMQQALGQLGELGAWSRSARYAAGVLVGSGDAAREGRAVLDELRAEGARDPERFVGVYVPWLAGAA